MKERQQSFLEKTGVWVRNGGIIAGLLGLIAVEGLLVPGILVGTGGEVLRREDNRMERDKESTEEKGEGGFSEKELDLDIEIRAGEWQNLKKFNTYKKRSRQGKIIATHQALSNRLAQLEKLFYQLASNHPQKAVKLLKEIKRLRFLKEYLLQALIWEEKKELEEHDIPAELKSLL